MIKYEDSNYPVGRLLLGLFLAINSLVGYMFFEGTAFGAFLSQSDWFGLTFIVLNFLFSHLLILAIRAPAISILSYILLNLLAILVGLAVVIGIPAIIIFGVFNMSGFFVVVVFCLFAIWAIATFLSKILSGSGKHVHNAVDTYFDSLRAGQERAYMEKLKNAKVNPEILAHMEKMEKEQNELKDKLKR